MNPIDLLLDYAEDNIQITKILEALTCTSANDYINFECFETLGDVFLKFVYCDYLIHNYEDADEGDLNNLKSEFTSNLMLWKLGSTAFDIEEFIIKDELEYCPIENNIRKRGLDEQFMTTNLFIPNLLAKQSDSYRPTLMASKQIADTIEALIGMFLLNTGFVPAKNFIQKLGIKITTSNKCKYPFVNSIDKDLSYYQEKLRE